MALSTQTNPGLNDPNDSRASAGNMRFALLPPFASTHSPKCGARVGSIVFARRSPSGVDASIENGKENGHELRIDTPGLITSTSRGVVPRLSRDHHRSMSAIRWIHVPFESSFFSLPGSVSSTAVHERYCLYPFLLRPCSKDTPQVAPSEWRTYAYKCQLDIVRLSDTPFTDPLYSQKRLTKSIKRSTALAHRDAAGVWARGRPDVFVHLADMTSGLARRAFAEGLVERLHGREADAVAPLRCLDEGVSAYVFDLVPLRLALEAAKTKQQPQTKQLSESDALPPTADVHV